MSKIKIQALSGRSLAIAQYALFLSLALAIPLFHSQYVTGPLVNAVLFLAAALSGSIGVFFIAMVPSVIALSAGLLPIVLAPAVPFIMLGNAILVAVFIMLGKKNFWLAMISASFAKFIFLFGSSQIVVGLIAKKQAAAAAASMLNYPQLITALAGGAIAWAVLKKLKRI
ncbi:MAG: iron hydrogenase [Candidatus Paceibacterota bacterium]